MSADEKITFTVMADCGVGEFIWVNYGPEPRLGVGPNRYSLMEEGAPQDDMTVELFADFCAWANRYMLGRPEDRRDEMNIDWDSFNAKGIELARRLKSELQGTGHTVRYARAWPDPKREQAPFVDMGD